LIGTVFFITSLNNILLIYSIFIWILFLIFSSILLHLSEKSLKYEKKELKIKRRFNPRNSFWIFLGLTILVILVYIL
ncbi:MAG: hypothetical protein KC516_03380, partial [Nanoarchaeota archaeon]|nr:hypothetical protein [Nanoarchaeota archaeon]